MESGATEGQGSRARVGGSRGRKDEGEWKKKWEEDKSDLGPGYYSLDPAYYSLMGAWQGLSLGLSLYSDWFLCIGLGWQRLSPFSALNC